jgi:hypothetical protein
MTASDPLLTRAEARLVALATAALGPDDQDPPGRPVAWLLAARGVSRVVRHALAARAEVGVGKYGGLLRRGWRFALPGAWQEGLDLKAYLEADPESTPEELAHADRLLELLTSRLLREPLDRPLSPSELRETA